MKFANLPSTLNELRALAAEKGLEIAGDRRKLATYRQALIRHGLEDVQLGLEGLRHGAHLAFQAALAVDGFCKIGAHLATRPEAIRFYARTAARMTWAAKRGAADIALTIQLFLDVCDTVWGWSTEAEDVIAQWDEEIDTFWEERTQALYRGEAVEPVEVVITRKVVEAAKPIVHTVRAHAWYYLVKGKRTVTANTWYYATKANLAIRKEVAQIRALGNVGALMLG